MKVALITGASRGLGLALSEELARRGWSLVLDGRDGEALEAATTEIRREAAAPGNVRPVTGDVTDPDHRRRLARECVALGGLRLLVNNASTLGGPLRPLEKVGLDVVRHVYEVNVLAPLALVQELLPKLRASPGPTVVNVTSDAGLEHYETWGAYGSSKAALEHLTATLAAEEPDVRFLTLDPGDMNTRMHEEAFPGDDVSDRPAPSIVAPRIVALVESPLPSGRYRAADVPLAPHADGAVVSTGRGQS